MRSFVSDRGSNVESNSRFDDFAHSGHNAIEQAFRQLISESYKFVRMSDDLHDVASHLSDIRICFMALTITVYLLLAVFLIRICIRRSQRQVGGTSRGSATGGTVGGNGSGAVISNAQRRHYPHNNRTSHWDYQTADEYQNAITTTTAQTDDLVSVRSDGQIGISTGAAKLTTPSGHMMGRNHRSTVTASGGTGAATIGIPLAQPAFMRHSGLHMNHQNAVATNAESSNEPTIPSCSNSGAHTSTNTVTRLGADVSSNQRFNTTNGNHLHHHHQIPHIVTSSSECQNTTSEVANSSDALNAQSFSTLRHHHHTSGPGPGAGQTSGNGSNACVNISETYANAQITFFDTPSLNCLRLHPRYCCSSRIRNACPGLCFAYPCNTPSAIKNFSINNASLLHHWNSQINKKPRQILPQNQILSSRKPLLQPQPQPPQGIVLPPVDTDLAKETQHSISFLESKKIQKKIEPPLQEQNNNLHSSTFGFFEAVQESIDLDNVNKQKITSMTRFPTLIPWTPTTTTSINSLISIEKIAPKSNLMPRDMNAAVDGEFRKKNENEQILLSRKNKMAGILEPPESSLISFGEASNDYATVKSEEQVSETTDIINVKNFENIPPIPTPPGTTWIPLIFNIKASDLNSSEAVRTTVDTPSVKTNTVNIVSALREIETELQGSISENQLSKIGITTKNPMYINVRDTEKIESQESKINNQKIEKSSEYINETDLILNASTKTKQIESRHNEPFIISSSFKRREDLPIPSEEKSIHFWEMRNNKLVKITSSKNGTQLEEGIGLFGNKINVIIDRLVTQETIDAINSIAGKKLKHQRQNEYTTKTTIIQFPPSHVPNIFVKSNEICGKAPDFHPCVLLSDANSRLVNCCKNKLLPEGCLKLCRYDTTQAEIKKEFDAGRCGILNVGPFLECASEDEDNIDCCRHQDIAKKSGPQCEVFCQPKRGLGILSLRHLSCQNVIGELLKCHHAGLRPR